MTNMQLMQEGLILMISGMGFVLIFLLALIFAIGLMSKIINQYFPDAIKDDSIIAQKQSTNNELELLRPVIVAAVSHYRRQKGLN